MRAIIVFVTIFVVLHPSNSKDTMDASALSSAIAKFSAKFCNELEKNKSVVSSPLSAEYVLGLLALGTTDEAHTEILESLGLQDDDSIKTCFSSLSAQVKDVKGITLHIANKVYIKDGGYELHPQLKEDAEKVFDAGLQKVDFTNSSAAASLINGWVESKTNHLIKDLLSADNFNSDTRLVLINALYFKGTWKKMFPAHNTMDQPFHINSGTSVNVPMMYQESEFRYGESAELDAQLLEMPYVGEQASMIIVLPREIEGLDQLMAKLGSGFDLMDEVNKNMYRTKVQVTIPKFKIETEIDLGEVLPKLGIKTIFDPQTNCITKLLDVPEPLYVSKAVQKAFIEVNEEGSEAAAATGMVMMMRCAPPPSEMFRADRPFLYLLVGPNRVPLFYGVYANA